METHEQPTVRDLLRAQIELDKINGTGPAPELHRHEEPTTDVRCLTAKEIQQVQWCATCNPRPAPAITIDYCPACEAREKRDLLIRLAAQRHESSRQAILGNAAIARLVPVLNGHTGQSYKLRGILYSLWNGMPFSWLEIVGLDTAIRKDLALLVTAWGVPGCFYDELKEAVTAAGQWHWFLEQGDDVAEMREYVQSVDERDRAVKRCNSQSTRLGRNE